MSEIKDTQILNEKLYNSNDIEEFLAENKRNLNNLKFNDYLYQLLDEKNMKLVDLFKVAQINESYGYQLLNGRRQPSRDKILQLGIAGKFSLSEVNRLLKLCERSELYVKDKRDTILMFAINKKMTLFETESFLMDQKIEGLIKLRE